MKNNKLFLKLFRIVFFPLLLLYIYVISPILRPSCRFQPSCSYYMMEALKIHGFYGLYLGIIRLLKCNPFGPSGFDPVPRNKEKLGK